MRLVGRRGRWLEVDGFNQASFSSHTHSCDQVVFSKIRPRDAAQSGLHSDCASQCLASPSHIRCSRILSLAAACCQWSLRSLRLGNISPKGKPDWSKTAGDWPVPNCPLQLPKSRSAPHIPVKRGSRCSLMFHTSMGPPSFPLPPPHPLSIACSRQDYDNPYMERWECER